MENKELHLVIVSPERSVYDGKASAVTLPGSLGKFQILPQHAPLLSSLSAGEVRYETGEEMHTLSIKGGFAEVRDNIVSVCAEL